MNRFVQTESSAFSGSVMNLNSRSQRVTVPQWSWTDSVKANCEDLIRLEKGWDGYGAPAVSLANVHFALRVLETICGASTPEPHIVPGPSGDLQIEWHRNGIDIELHVRGVYDVMAWRRSPQTGGDGEELHCRQEFAAVAGWVDELSDHCSATAAAA